MLHPNDEKSKLDFQTQNFMLIPLKEIQKKYSRSSPDPENSRSGHRQPYIFFSVFADFETLPNNSGKPESVDSKQKI